MDILKLVNKEEGNLIHFKKTAKGYLAPAYKGIVRLDNLARIKELGVDHNATLKLCNPIDIDISILDKKDIKKVKYLPSIAFGTLMRKHRFYFEKGKLDIYSRYDVNTDGELIVSIYFFPTKEIYKCNLLVKFSICDDFYEIINSEEYKTVAFENDNGKVLFIKGMLNIDKININNSKSQKDNYAICEIFSEEITTERGYNPMQFKISLIK